MNILNQVKRRAKHAGFEAERLLRINRVQSRMSTLNSQLSSGITRLGYLTYDLAHRGEINQPELRQFCTQLDQIRAQITAAEEEIRAIQAETPPGDELVNAYCVNCGTPGASGARFCARCGGALQPPAPPAPPAPVPAAWRPCPSCGTLNTTEVRFCVQCGRDLASTAPPTPTPSPTPVVAAGNQDVPTLVMPGLPPRATPRSSAPIPASPAAGAAPSPTPAAEDAAQAADAPVPHHDTTNAEAAAPPANTIPDEPARISMPVESLGAAGGTVATATPHDAPPAVDPDAPPELPATPIAASATLLAHRCAVCAQEIPEDAHYCIGCGAQVAG